MRKTRGTALLAAAAVAVTALGACGEEGGSEESSTTASPSGVETESSSGSSEPSEEDSGSESGPGSASGSSASGDGDVVELPAEAKKHTKAGAIAFNEFYQHQLGEALVSGKTETLKTYSLDCEVCNSFISATEKATAQGITVDRNPYSVHDLSAKPREEDGYRVTLTVKSSGYQEVLPDGSKGGKSSAETYTLVTNTQWHDGHWVLQDSVITG